MTYVVGGATATSCARQRTTSRVSSVFVDNVLCLCCFCFQTMTYAVGGATATSFAWQRTMPRVSSVLVDNVLFVDVIFVFRL